MQTQHTRTTPTKDGRSFARYSFHYQRAAILYIMSLEQRPTEGDTEWTVSANSVTPTMRDPAVPPPGPPPSFVPPENPPPPSHHPLSSSPCRSHVSSSSTSVTIVRTTKEQHDAMRPERHCHHHHLHGNNNISDATLLVSSMTSSPSSSSSSWYDPGHGQSHNRIPAPRHHHHHDDPNEEDDDGDRLDRLFHHDKDYVDLPPKPIRNFKTDDDDDDDDSTIQTLKTREYTSVTDLPPTKLRSFSEPEVSRMDTTAVLLHDDDEETTSPNVLRHRFSNRTTTNNNLLYPHEQQPQSTRGRAYTADHFFAYRSYYDDDHVMTTPRGDLVARTAFHSSWDDDDDDHSLCTTTASSLTNHTTTTTTTPAHALSHTKNTNHNNIDTLTLITTTSTTWSQQMIEAEVEGGLSSLSSSSSSSPPPLDDPLAQQPTPNDDLRSTANNVTHHYHQHHTRSRTVVNDHELERQQQQQQSPQVAARRRWIRINRRFQMIVAVVVVIFSILVFGIFLCWIVWAGTFFRAEPCQVQLKRYFWLATLQLVLDLFRTCLLRVVFRWNPRSPESIPGRVMAYYIVYLIYAACVLRLGIASVFATTTTEDAKCQTTAPDFFHASAAFVSLSLAAWMTIIVGYLIPFCVVAVLLTINGYNPNTSSTTGGSNTPPFPFLSCGYTTVGTPPGCVDQLRTIELQHLPGSLDSKECCICMEAFIEHDVIVITKCEHIFHKQCCREWLRQASTCPVCREDIPSSLEQMAGTPNHRHENELLPWQTSHTRHVEHPSPPPSHLPVSNLLRVILDARNQLTDRNGVASPRGARISPIVSSSGFANDIERG